MKRMNRQPVRGAQRCFIAFTLIELLVVVAIIGVVAAILLPAIQGSRYRAQVMNCASQIRQISYGIVAYTGDYDGYYPDGRNGRPGPAAIALGQSGTSSFDFRPALREYFGTPNLSKIMVCPLADKSWWVSPPSTTNPYDIDNFRTNNTTQPVKSPYNFYFGQALTGVVEYELWPRTMSMRKVGQYFSPSNTTARFSLIMSDFVLGNSQTLTTTHRPGRSSASPAGTVTNANRGYQYPLNAGVIANYAFSDCSVKTYNFPAGTALTTSNFISFSGVMASEAYLIPLDAAK